MERPITLRQLYSLRDSAVARGDLALELLCDEALEDDREAQEVCARLLADGEPASPQIDLPGVL